ncbi:AraC family transcriptional regulator [Aeoliella mucimassa]|uniref:Xylose operon regulatory protein n=1 Tax=Aeoliella mucimassa TaxID=2527972 RepID=A0A518AQN9_9BACT|nr:XylR family transcriptional regulator [Aeoliella mucimassa]QDU57042.1 Xylose operon regulatory protein [Aeoliella mucimassa]
MANEIEQPATKERSAGEAELRVKHAEAEKPLRHVTLLVESSTTWGSDIVQGIADYANDHANWVIYYEPRGKYEVLHLPDDWRGDGVIARVTTESLGDQIVAAKVPAVNVSWHAYHGGLIPRCTTSERLSAEMIAQHFLDRGFRRFAYFGDCRRAKHADLFGSAFIEIIEQSGFVCHKHPCVTRNVKEGAPTRQEQLELMEWVQQLPKPIALLAFNDVRGRQVVEACRQSGIAVPDDIAVMGGEHDKLASQMSRPRLSSIDLSSHRVGFEAAKLLDRMMAGKQPPTDPILIPPARILVHASTDTLAVEDELVSQALHFIAAQLHRPINVKHILEHVPTSRRVLEQRFRDLLGRAPAEEIRRARIERTKRLLAETDKSLRQIARDCGFLHAEVLSRVFRRTEGITPSEYRKRVRTAD